MSQSCQGQADHLCADPDASFIEGFDGDFIPFADFAQHIPVRNTTLLEDQLTGGGRANPELVFLLTDSDPGEVTLDQEGRDAAIAGLGLGVRKENKQAASLALVVQSLRPVISNWSPLSSALVVRAKASLPAPGSDRA